MKIKVNSSEINRIMKTIGRCLDSKKIISANVQIVHEDGMLTFRATNSTFMGEMFLNVPGGDGTSFCVDGDMLGKIISLCSGDVEIMTDDKNCAIKGIGRTRIPIIKTTVPEFEKVAGKTVTVMAEELKRCYSLIHYAIAVDQSRPLLTGICTESNGTTLRMVAMDGFQIALEEIPCEGDTVKIVIPGAFMDLVTASTKPGDKLTLITDGKRIQAETAGMRLMCPLLIGEYTDYSRVIPSMFSTEALADSDKVRESLKSGNVVNNKLGTVRVSIGNQKIIISNNGMSADFEANIPCEMVGENIMIAFNEKYLMNAINVIETDQFVMKLNTRRSPVLIQGKGRNGIHICMPVNLAEVQNAEKDE